MAAAHAIGRTRPAPKGQVAARDVDVAAASGDGAASVTSSSIGASSYDQEIQQAKINVADDGPCADNSSAPAKRLLSPLEAALAAFQQERLKVHQVCGDSHTRVVQALGLATGMQLTTTAPFLHAGPAAGQELEAGR